MEIIRIMNLSLDNEILNVDANDKTEWIKERADIIFEGNGGENSGFYSAAEMMARRCWDATFGDPQKSLF